jgi:hypothetical protein
MGHLCVADLDGSNGVDLALLNPTVDSLLVRLNNGSGGFTTTSLFESGSAGSYGYFVLPIDVDGDSDSDLVVCQYSANSIRVLFNDGLGGFVTDIAEPSEELLPGEFRLSQNYPNPFNPMTEIQYYLPIRSHVTIDIFNVLGRRVRSLVDREESAGSYSVSWDGTDLSGKRVASGVYLYRFQTDNHMDTKRMVLLK